MEFLSLCLLTLWLYLPGFLANTFAMMWGSGFRKRGMARGPLTVDVSWRTATECWATEDMERPYRRFTDVWIAVHAARLPREHGRHGHRLR